MASKRKMRRVSPQHREAMERIHDRRAADLPINAQVAPITVDDPYGTETGEKIVVFRSLRDDPIGAMHARNQVDQAQYAAARHWQRCYEAVEISGAQAIDTTKEAVDGGRMAEPLSDHYSRAWDDLRKADKELGPDLCAIVRDVLGANMILLHVAAKRDLTTEWQILSIGRKFRRGLDILAVVFGYTSPPQGVDKTSGQVYAFRHTT